MFLGNVIDFNEDFNNSGNCILDWHLKTKSADIDMYVEETSRKLLSNELIKFPKHFLDSVIVPLKQRTTFPCLRKLGLKIQTM